MAFRVNSKGQSAIEFVLLLVVLLVFVQVVIVPTVNVAQDAATDVSRLGQTRLAAQQLADAVDLMASAAEGARETIHIVVPQHSKVECDSANKVVKFSSTLDSNAGMEGKANCDPAGNSQTAHQCWGTLAVSASTLSCPESPYVGKLLYTLRVDKVSGGGVSVSKAGQ